MLRNSIILTLSSKQAGFPHREFYPRRPFQVTIGKWDLTIHRLQHQKGSVWNQSLSSVQAGCSLASVSNHKDNP